MNTDLILSKMFVKEDKKLIIFFLRSESIYLKVVFILLQSYEVLYIHVIDPICSMQNVTPCSSDFVALTSALYLLSTHSQSPKLSAKTTAKLPVWRSLLSKEGKYSTQFKCAIISFHRFFHEKFSVSMYVKIIIE